MRTIWRLALFTVVMLGWIATYYHHSFGWVFSVIAAVMILMSCAAEAIAEVRGW